MGWWRLKRRRSAPKGSSHSPSEFGVVGSSTHRDVIQSFDEDDFGVLPPSLRTQVHDLSTGDWQARWALALATPRLLHADVIDFFASSGRPDIAGLLNRLREVGAEATRSEFVLLLEMESIRAQAGSARPRRVAARLCAVMETVMDRQARWLLPSLYDVAVDASKRVGGPTAVRGRIGTVVLDAACALVGASEPALMALLHLKDNPSDSDWSNLASLLDIEEAERLAQTLIMFGEAGIHDGDNLAWLEDRIGLAFALASRGVDSARAEYDACVLARLVVVGRIDPPSMRGEALASAASECLQMADEAGSSWLIKPGLAAARVSLESDPANVQFATVAALLTVAGCRERYLSQSDVVEAVKLLRRAYESAETLDARSEIGEYLSDALAVGAGWGQLDASVLVEAVDLMQEVVQSARPDSSECERLEVVLGMRTLEAAAEGLLPLHVVADSEPHMRAFADTHRANGDLSVQYNLGLWFAKGARLGALPVDRWASAIHHLRLAVEIAAACGIRELRYEHQLATALLNATLVDGALPVESHEAVRQESATVFANALQRSDTDNSDYLAFLLDYAHMVHLRMLEGSQFDELASVLEVFRDLVNSLENDWRDVSGSDVAGLGTHVAPADAPAASKVSARLASAADTLSGLLSGAVQAGIHSLDSALEAVAYARIAVANTPPNDLRYPSTISNLAGKISIAVSYGQLEVDALDEAVRLGRKAIAGAAPHEPDLPTYRLNLAGALFQIYREDNSRVSEANEAIGLLTDAIDVLPEHHPERRFYVTNLAAMISEFPLEDLKIPEQSAVLELHRQALAGAAVDGALYLNLLLNYGTSLAVTVGQVGTNQRATVDELQRVLYEIWHLIRYGLAHPSRRLWAVGQGVHFVNTAPGRLLAYGYVAEAVTAVEAARGALMSSMAAPHIPADVPRALAREFQTVAERYNEMQIAVLAGIATVADASAAGKQLLAAINHVRQHTGTLEFAGPPQLAQLAATLQQGEVGVYVLPDRDKGAALCVYPDGEVINVPLPSFTHDEVQRHVDALLVSTGDVQQLCSELWDTFAAPLLDTIAGRGARVVTLVPTARAAMLPLHAAGDARRGWLHEHLNVRYAPALNKPSLPADYEPARSTAPARKADASRRFAAISTDSSLAFAGADQAALARYFSIPESSTRPTVADVVARLDDADLCFISGHARHALNEGAGVLLEDGILTADVLSTLPRKRRQLAFLNACSSGQIATALPNENIGLPSAFLSLGFEGVVASMWPIRDSVAFVALARFAQVVVNDGRECSSALDAVRAWLRTATASDVRSWVAQLPDEIGLHPALVHQLSESIASFPDPAAPFADPTDWASLVYYGRDLSLSFAGTRPVG